VLSALVIIFVHFVPACACRTQTGQKTFNGLFFLFSNDLIFSIEYLRFASGGSILKRPIKEMTERHAAQAPALRERLPQIFNSQ